jgi:hypothetical protein
VKFGMLGVIAGTMLIGGAALLCGSAHAQTTAPKAGVAPTGGEQKESSQVTTRRSSESSTLPIPADVPKATRVDPGK